MNESLLRLPQVLALTGWSRSSLYAAIKRGEFPKQIAIGARAVAWPQSSVQEYITQKIEQSRKAAA